MSDQPRTSFPGVAARRVTIGPPSFPAVTANVPLGAAAGVEWTVVCGDADHWRAGIYSPAASSSAELAELERHTCPEAFVLLSGRVALVLADGCGDVHEVELLPGKPVLVTAPHKGLLRNNYYILAGDASRLAALLLLEVALLRLRRRSLPGGRLASHLCNTYSVTGPNGFCPEGPHRGAAFVVERDSFSTEVRVPGG